MGSDPVLSVVVIGRNEGPRLERCLRSVLAMADPGGPVEILYVDSASTDDSREIAARLGARVIAIQPKSPTAASGRNAGWRAASAPFVLFLDGDTILDPRFAVDSLADFRPETAAICGNRREIRPRDSMFNRVLDLDWMGPAGIVDYCGGDALIRRQALEEVNGYDETLIAGEEPEMCRRMRAKGWKILRVDRPMTGHDLAMTSWRQYWKRSVRTGYAYAEVSERFRGSGLPFWESEARHNRDRAIVWSGLIAGTVLVSAISLTLWPFLALAGLIALLSVRTAMKAAWRTPDWGTRLLYGIHSHLQQIPIYLGQLQYWNDRRAGRRRGLIEYKGGAQ